MKLTSDIKQKIQEEYDFWKNDLWAGKDKAARAKLGQFATPPELVFKMLEKFGSLEDKDILDPCLGAGNLIAGAIIAGANPKRCYGIELDLEVLELAKKRLGKLGVPAENLKRGNILDPDSYLFGDEAPAPKSKREKKEKLPHLPKVGMSKIEFPASIEDPNKIVGRTFEALLSICPGLSAGKVWRLWAEEAKQAYARYNAWKVGKPRDEVNAVHTVYRQWKIDQEAKWCKHFNAKNPNDRRK